MGNLERKLPKLAAFTAPFMILGAAALESGCSQNQPKTPAEASRTQEGEVKPALSNPTTLSTIEIISITPTTTPSTSSIETTPDAQSGMQIAYNEENMVLEITDGNYRYEIIPDWDFSSSNHEPTKKRFAKYTNNQLAEDVWAKIAEAAQIQEQNSTDPRLLTLATESLEIMEPYCNGEGTSFPGFVRGIGKGIVSAVYNSDPQNWPNVKERFLKSPCFTKELI